MALQQAEKNQFGTQIAQELSETLYACSSLTLLSGGTANFLFRGVLAQPLQDGTKTIIIKHSKEFVSANRHFQLDVSRCVGNLFLFSSMCFNEVSADGNILTFDDIYVYQLFEVIMLNALDSFPSTAVDKFYLRTPHLYLFDQKTNTQVLEDLSGMIDMKAALESPTAPSILTQSISTDIGRSLGAWLRSFHSWASEPAQAGLQREMGENKPMRKIRYSISYGAFIDVVQKFPEIWEGCKKALEEVRDMATAEYAKNIEDKVGENWGIIHGDFWSGNSIKLSILIPNTPSPERQQLEGTNLFVIDWELAQFGRKEYDLGQMIGDLYERKHFRDANSAVWIIQGFVTGYGALSDEMAFRIAIHAGVHLICWYIRRDPTAPFTKPLKQIQDAIRIGTDFIVKGWEKDRTWFEGTFLENPYAAAHYLALAERLIN
uniref:DmxR19 n=1 Tax=Cryptosporiopsis sp. (strain 8999) TaxID=2572248 RepID=A0A4P8DJG2_CRYX8|nr:DmxR19 [Cryptosporiopsis sp. 8999]